LTPDDINKRADLLDRIERAAERQLDIEHATELPLDAAWALPTDVKTAAFFAWKAVVAAHYDQGMRRLCAEADEAGIDGIHEYVERHVAERAERRRAAQTMSAAITGMKLHG
jgi:hypothetical protein